MGAAVGLPLYPQFLTKYDVQSVDAGITLLLLRFLVGSTGAITSFSHQGSKHIRLTLRLKAGYYGIYLDGVWYVERASNLAINANPLTPMGAPTVIGPLSTSAGTLGQVVNDQSAGQGNRIIAWLTGDAVVASTKTFTIGNGAFTAADVGAPFVVAGSAQGNDGTYHIATVTNTTTVVVEETVTANETFPSTINYSIQGAFIVIAFSQTGTPGAADVASGAEVSFVFSLKSEAP